jgi:DNA-binding transcriptional ArsR family regulator
MPLTNPYGDMEISDPQALRALAHPTRLAILERLQRYGPSTATLLSPYVGATPSVVSWHLRHLARFGFVTDWEGAGSRRERGWQAVARGYRFVPRDGDPETMAAARQLERERFPRAVDTLLRWLETDELLLPNDWRQESGLANTRVRVTLAELRAIEAAFEDVLTPYVRRREDEMPPDARDVRMLRFLLPEAPEASAASEAREAGQE